MHRPAGFATLVPMDERSAGLVVVIVCAAVVLIGLLLAAGALSWVGRLPGDVRFSGGSVRIFVPLTTMLLLSLGLSLALFTARRLFR